MLVKVGPGHHHVSGRTASTNIYVTDSPEDEALENVCYHIGSVGSMDNLHVRCPRPMIGRYVKLIREPEGYQYWRMNLCEIQVFGYLHEGKSPLV